mgnify:CR=1 FL=1
MDQRHLHRAIWEYFIQASATPQISDIKMKIFLRYLDQLSLIRHNIAHSLSGTSRYQIGISLSQSTDRKLIERKKFRELRRVKSKYTAEELAQNVDHEEVGEVENHFYNLSLNQEFVNEMYITDFFAYGDSLFGFNQAIPNVPHNQMGIFDVINRLVESYLDIK